MDSKEIHRAMRLRLPVMYEGKRYEYMDQYISWFDKTGKNCLSVRLIDSQRNCHYVLAAKVTLAE